jgi:prepilin signal peptidase PulO-like enzyme (type II secretory pathway)
MSYLFIIITLTGLSIIDEESRMVPEGLSLLAILAGLFIHTFSNTANMAIYGLIAGILSVCLLNQTRLIKLGGGDAKVIGIIGASLGWQIALITLAIAVLIFKLFFKNKKQVAFVPIIFEAFVIVTVGIGICHLVKLL